MLKEGNAPAKRGGDDIWFKGSVNIWCKDMGKQKENRETIGGGKKRW